jgi:hypothetical protein
MSYPVRDIEHAFPTVFPCEEYGSGYRGLSMRDYFAAAALQGLLATYDISKIHPALRDKYKVERMPIIADESYKLADAMLATRKEGA